MPMVGISMMCQSMSLREAVVVNPSHTSDMSIGSIGRLREAPWLVQDVS